MCRALPADQNPFIIPIHYRAVTMRPELAGRRHAGRCPDYSRIARMAWAIMIRGERYKEPKLLLAA